MFSYRHQSIGLLECNALYGHGVIRQAGKNMVGCSERRQDIGLVRKIAALILSLALLFPLTAIAQTMAQDTLDSSTSLGGGMLLGGGISTNIVDPCANVLDKESCRKKLIANRLGQIQSEPETSLPPQRTSSKATTARAPAEPNEFQEFITASVGKKLPMYGYDLFNDVPDTFAPVENIPVTQDYPIGPGDEIVIKGWGQVDINVRAVVNRNGEINLPKVGSINVAGIRYQELQNYLKSAIGKVFRNFDLNVTLGKLRSIQVFVVGQARRPGAYTVSSLSTLVNTLFVSGGPSSKGSMRHIQVKRNGKVVTDFDLYDLLLKGDKTNDVALLPGDVIYIPSIGQLVAIYGGINNSAIYELKNDKTTLADLIELAGGFTTTASGQKVKVERIEERKVRKVEELQLDKAGLARMVRDGDLVQVLSIEARFDNAVTLRGNVADPGRYPWKEGMRVKDLIPDMESLIVPQYWEKQNRAARIVDVKNVLRTDRNDRNDVKRSTAEINWDYAVIERMRKEDLTTTLIPFNLGKAITGKDAEQNLLLQPGDTVTIFSKDDIQIPVAKQSVYVRLEGEINAAGVYKALPGETLRQLVARIGGLTPSAYLFGAEFTRESVREMQQQKLKEMADRMEEAVRRNLSNKASTALTPEDVASSKAQEAAQIELVTRMRKTRASGRVVLEIPPENAQMKDLPDLVLDDGDRFMVPAKPSVVSVMGMVYNENAFMYRPGRSVGDYLGQAGGPTRDADESRMYVLRADGAVLSAQSSSSLFNTFSGGKLMPGDTVVVPEMLDKFSFTKELKDWAQIFYQFALGVAGIKVLRM